MARSGSNDRAPRNARRQKRKARTSLAPESTSRASHSVPAPPPLPPSEDTSVIRERTQLSTSSAGDPEQTLDLDDDFFSSASLALELTEEDLEVDPGLDNPELSPAERDRRRLLRRRVAALMAALALFSLLMLLVRLAQ